MLFRIAGLTAAAATTIALTGGTAAAAPRQACPASVNRPCVWQQPAAEGIVGGGRLDPADAAHPVMLRVEVRVQRAWGSPWQTVAAATLVTTGPATVTTPAVKTDYRTIVCATGGPADRPELHVTNCTF
ncbi:hypothetical protein [Kitasatospora sp. NPDC059571]|uniref:hypothetical protein n=1 Tax=Kitasatospora sp. NPDC059571 TaxID=3346871 RepID=UPI0036D1A927